MLQPPSGWRNGAPHHPLGVVSAAFDAVVDALKAFGQRVQSYVEHSDVITQFFDFLGCGFGFVTGKCGFLCEGYIAINAITDHG